ncbi:MAG: tape measure protein [Sulfurimicrobium sp.]|nr:tape measure protein [Sulfurimicrobium sp.]
MANAPKLEIIIGAKADQLKAALADLTRSLNALSGSASQAGAQTAGAFQGAETQLGRTRSGVQSISEQLSVAKTQLIAFFSIQYGIGLAKDLIQTADAFTSMNSRLKLATQSSVEYTTAQAALFAISQRTATSLESNIILYARIADSMRAMGKSQQDALVFTELTGQAMRISGASAESAKAGVTQLAQAMASGVLRGDEFNSIMENSPRLAKALADGLNVPIGALRAMAEAGQLTADKVVGALLSQADTLSSEYANVALTVGASLTQISNAWTKYIGEADQAEGATKSLALAISDIAANFTGYANTVLTLGRDALVIWLGFGAVKLGAAAAEFAALMGVTTLQTAAMRENAAATATAATASAAAASAATALATAEKAAAAQAVISAQAHKNIAFAAMAEAEATLAAMKAASLYGPARAAAERAVTAARVGLTAATAQLVVAENAAAAAIARAGAAAAVAAPAVTRLSLASGLLMKALGPLLLAFVAFEGLKIAGQWLGEFAAKLVVGDQEVKKFSSGAKLGMEVAAAATKAMKQETANLIKEIERTNQLSAFELVGESAEAAAVKIEIAAAGIVADFGEVYQKSQDVGKALDAMFAGINVGSPASMDAMTQAMYKLGESGMATGKQIQDGLGRAIDKLGAEQLIKLQTSAASALVGLGDLAKEADKTAAAIEQEIIALKKIPGNEEAVKKLGEEFRAASENAKMLRDQSEQLGPILEKSLGRAFALLGGELEKFRTGIDQASRDAILAFQAIAENARASGREIGEAFNLALKTADTKREVQALGEALKKSADDGVIAGRDLEDAQTRLAAKVRETAGEVEGALGDAFKRAGIKSKEELSAIADQAKADFEAISKSGQATAEGIATAEKKYNDAKNAALGLKEAAAGAADETARISEEAKQAAINAQSLAAEMAAAASAMAHYASNAAKDAAHLSAANQAINDAWRNSVSAVQQYIDQMKEAGRATAGFESDLAYTMTYGTVAAMEMLEAQLRQVDAADKLAQAYVEIESSARSAAKSAEDAVRGFLSSSRSIHEELLTAQGKEDEAAKSRMESRKLDLKLQYAQLQIQIKIAEVQAAAAGIDTSALKSAAADAAAAYSQSLRDLDALQKINEQKSRDSKAAEAAAKQAAEQSARDQADDLLKRVSDPSYPSGASSAAAAAAASSAAGGVSATTNNYLTITVDGKDLLSEDQIRNKIAPVITKMLNGAR